jgi:CHAD domain-containing protein
MNSSGVSSGTQANVRARVAAWRDLLERCGRKPTRRRVHALRVVTLRIQAELEHELIDLPRASHQAQAMLRFGKLGERLRQSLGQVRELDVWIGKLAALRTSLSEKTEYVPRSTRECVRQMERLEDRLEKKRQSAGEKLAREIKNRRDDLIGTADAVDEAAGDRTRDPDGNGAAAILKEFAAVAADFPAFDEENLHDFRKRIKKVRYLAELHSDDAESTRIAAQIKKVQTAIGEWHDWQVLARTARHGQHSRDAELAELLQSLTEERFAEAVAACHGLTARLLEPTTGARKPPTRNGHIAESRKKLA